MNTSRKTGRTGKQWSIACLLVLFFASVVPANTYAAETSVITQQWEKTKAFYQQSELLADDWGSIHRLYAGLPVDEAYLQTVNTKISEGALPKKPTSVALTIVGLSAAGVNAEQFVDVNYVNQLLSMEKSSLSAGTNEAAWTLLALDSGSYTADDTVTRDWLISTLLEMQQTDGTWPGFQPDMTTMAMTALAPYNTSDHPDIQMAINKAASAFEGTIPDNSNSIAQLIIALSANGMDANATPFTDDKSTSLVDALLSYALEDGSFYWNAEQTESNAFATKDAFHALLAYVTYQKEGKGQIYNDLLQKRNNLDQPESGNQITDEPTTTAPDEKSVNIKLTVSSNAKQLASENVEASTPLQGLKKVLEQNDIPFTIQDTEFGPYLSGIAGLEAGTIDANAGWQFAITRDGKTSLPGAAANAPELLEAGDGIHFFYGGFGVGPASDASATIIGPSTIAVAVEKAVTTYDSSYNASITYVPASDVTVSFGGATATTNAHGIAVLNNVTDGADVIKIDDYQADSLPSIVPSTIPIQLDGMVVDELWVDAYAKASVKKAIENEWMRTQEVTGAFLPDMSLTRAEVIQLLIQHLPHKPSNSTPLFADVTTSSPFADSIHAAHEAGWIKGEEDGNFHPNEEVTRQELSLILARALQLPATEVDGSFNDETTIWPEARPAVYALHSAGIFKGTGSLFLPSENVTREMAAVILDRLHTFNESSHANAS
ncbi:S-layer homology domain-containing protein [Aureibacillus halotolerans]|uniref:S-layer family protein n=1 Tax=Aureibacillus halotolerans TaxID=1508390 RepID=A0A4R6UAF3_9BACI|nr:S-layer homology domain-containing protein [Aureibacillus halotolerans]TDQ42023.1 S-layer family protein [Aureibacillus halotolerans]